MSFAVACLGGEIVIDTVDGPVLYEVKPGTGTDTRVRLRGKGVPSLRDAKTRGDHYVTLVVQIPNRVSHEAKELLKQFDAITGDSLNAATKFREEHGAGADTDPKKSKRKKFF